MMSIDQWQQTDLEMQQAAVFSCFIATGTNTEITSTQVNVHTYAKVSC